jgi:hypothetical protein
MGAESFSSRSKGKTAKEAFNKAAKEARYDCGHRGYTGTIAEKENFVMIQTPKDKNADDYANELMDNNDRRINDKWGPAGCIHIKDDEYLFFGWASS